MNASSTAREIIGLFQRHGHINYGENCTQASHSVQAGLIARGKNLEKELILAGFLHDIGHLAPLDSHVDFERMGDYGVQQHDLIGGAYLEARGFSKKIIATVKNHVASKRYLCAVDAQYYEELSHASRETLAYQGGPMSGEELAAFEVDPFFEESLAIRRIDEEAKAMNFEITDEHWNYFEELIRDFFETNTTQTQ